MNLKYEYYWYQNALTKQQCSDVIAMGLNKMEENRRKGQSNDGVTYSDNYKGSKGFDVELGNKTIQEIEKEHGTEAAKSKTYVRDSKIAFLDDQSIYDILWPLIKRANSDTGWHWDIDFCEAPQFTVYKEGQFYGWHTDGGSCHNMKYKLNVPGVTQFSDKEKYSYVFSENYVGKVRKISCTINLNEGTEYEGGDLMFDMGQQRTDQFHKVNEIRKAGSMIVFPSFQKHSVQKITKGTRYSLVAWFLGRPWR
jgi:PKHD-type hydroxylase